MADEMIIGRCRAIDDFLCAICSALIASGAVRREHLEHELDSKLRFVEILRDTATRAARNPFPELDYRIAMLKCFSAALKDLGQQEVLGDAQNELEQHERDALASISDSAQRH